jgi:hypothetical protein
MGSTEQRDVLRRRKAVAEFLLKHVDDYTESPARTRAIKDYLASKNLPVTLESLEEAFQFLKDHGVDLTSAVTAQQAEAQDKKIKAVDSLPKIPDAAHIPQFSTRAELRLIDGVQFKEFRQSKFGKQFMARVAAVLALPEETK